MANTEKQTCPQCGAPLDFHITVCKYCGAENAVKPQNSTPQPQQQYTQQPNQYAQQPGQYAQQPNQYAQQPKQYVPNQYAQQAPPRIQQAPPRIQQVPPQYIPPQAPIYSQTVIYNTQDNMSGYYPYKQKSKVLAGVLALLFGGLGIHKFYTGHIGWGIVYLLFCWAYIPTIVGIIEGIIYLCTSSENFNLKYVKHKN